MMFESYFHIKRGLIKRFDEKQKKINSDIHIRDIFVYPEEPTTLNAYGEFYRHKRAFTLPRLIDHVQTLAEFANVYHQKYYCTEVNGKHVIKPDCLNKITRLSLSEFLLFTAQPMSIEEFQLFYTAVLAIAKNQQSNVHLLLSSISIRTKDNTILNASLYVQCGREAKIDVVCKAMASNSDAAYAGTENFKQTNDLIFPMKTAGFIAKENNNVISNQAIFTVETAGGAQYVQGIDICLDHQLQHALSLMQDKLDYNNEMDIIPNQVNHFLTSCSILALQFSKMTKLITQNDAVINPVIHKHIENDLVTETDLMRCNRSKTTLASKTENGYLIKNPSFGSNLKMVVTKEKKLDEFIPQLKNWIDKRNNQRKINFYKSRFQVNKNYSQCISSCDKTVNNLYRLYESLLEQCRPGFWETLFKTKNYLLKIQAKETVEAFLNITKKWQKKDDIYIMQHLDGLLSSLKDKLLKLDYGIPNPFLIDMVNYITVIRGTHFRPLKLN